MEILYFIVTFIIGGVIAWFIQSARLRTESRVLIERNASLDISLKEAKGQLADAQEKTLALTGTLATAQADLANAKEMEARHKVEFENLANRTSENLYEELFLDPGVQELYMRGIALMDKEYPQQKHFKDPDEGLAAHLVLAFMYYYEKFGFDHPLFVAFWKNNNPEQHAHFVSFLGRLFISGSNTSADELLKKEPRSKQHLIDMWDLLLKSSEKPRLFEEFGFWINLKKEIFEPVWLAEHVKKTLEKSKGIMDWEIGLTDSIIALAKAAPEDTLAIIRLFFWDGGIKAAQPKRMPLRADREWYEAIQILYGNPKTKSGTYALIDDLIREGGQPFWDLKKVLDKDGNSNDKI